MKVWLLLCDCGEPGPMDIIDIFSTEEMAKEALKEEAKLSPSDFRFFIEERSVV